MQAVQLTVKESTSMFATLTAGILTGADATVTLTVCSATPALLLAAKVKVCPPASSGGGV